MLYNWWVTNVIKYKEIIQHEFEASLKSDNYEILEGVPLCFGRGIEQSMFLITFSRHSDVKKVGFIHIV